MKLARRWALATCFLAVSGCASMSDRYYVAGNDGGGDYYFAPAQDEGYDPYGHDFDFYFRYGWGSPFGYGPFGYGAWWNGWPYVPPLHHDFVVVPDPPSRVAERSRRPEFRQPEARELRFPAPDDATADRRGRGVRPISVPQAPARRQSRGDSPIP